jgi:hypothetical protein
MRWNRGLLCALLSVSALALPVTNLAEAQTNASIQNASIQEQNGSASSLADRSESPTLAELPDSPSSSLAQQQDTANQERSSSTSAQTAQAPQPGAGDAAQTEEDKKLQRPVGTAAAEAPKVSGITAAQPAGIAIAPAKQHRVRTIAIKVGAIIGAGVALGTVIALTEATPSKPPGAH